ncbi:MAG: amidohydrolase [Phycisphaerales bacterium]
MGAQAVNESSQPRELREAHAHLPWLGRALDMLSLDGCQSAGEALDRIAARTGPSSGGHWIQAHSARVTGWREGTWFDRAALDRVSGPTPTLVMSFDHHAVFANSAALSKAGIDQDTPDPAGGIIDRDAKGVPTGLLLEVSAFSAWALAPEPPESARANQIERALDHLAGLGFVEVHELFAPLWLGPLLADIQRTSKRDLKIGLFVPLEVIQSASDTRETWQSDDLRLLGGKIFTDGTLNSRTAWMLEPFADAPPGLEHGKPLMNASQIGDAIAKCASLGLGIAMHAIGDGAVRACLDGMQRWKRAGAANSDVRVRIEHCELVDKRDVSRFADLGAIASVQPCHLLTDVEALRAGVPNRLHRVMPWRDLIRAGLIPGETLLFGSDVPVVRADPADSMQASVHRRRATDSLAIAPEQAITEAEAWKCFTCSPRM